MPDLSRFGHEFHYLTMRMLYNRCMGFYKFGNNAYPWHIRRRSNLGHIFREKVSLMGWEIWYLLNYLLTYLPIYLLTYLLTYLFTYLLTYSIQRSPWEVNWFPTSQIPCILWNPVVPYCVYECTPPVPILGQMNPVHASPLHFLKIHFNVVFHLCQGHLSVLFPSGFHTKTLTAPLLFPAPVTCPAHLILCLFTWIIFGD
jgi:hypothetical protein